MKAQRLCSICSEKAEWLIEYSRYESGGMRETPFCSDHGRELFARIKPLSNEIQHYCGTRVCVPRHYLEKIYRG